MDYLPPKRLLILVMILSALLSFTLAAKTTGGRRVTKEEREKILKQRDEERREFEKIRNGTKVENTNKDHCDCGVSKVSSKIINGYECGPHSHPWMIALYVEYLSKKYFICGGSIINDFYILTAAHCTEGYTISELSAKLGDHNIDQNFDDATVQIVTFSDITEHPSYDPNTVDYDCSLLKTDSQITFTNEILPICLPPPGLNFYRQTATILGWGETVKYSSVLLCQTVTTINYRTCGITYGYDPSEITKRMFCAKKKNVDTCYGDSGGPVEYLYNGKTVQVGITSWGYGCAQRWFPGVYSNVVEMRDWILQQASSGHFCV